MSIAPFGELPLNTTTYSSRVDELLSRPVNYVLTGFKPGYALQASELNELQEQFYVQHTLTNRCMSNWYYDTEYLYTMPFWSGTTPYTSSLITNIRSIASVTVTAGVGWYYLIDSTTPNTNLSINSGIGFWVYNDVATSITIAFSELSSTVTSFGFSYTFSEINSIDDSSLHDNANAANATMSIPGADRIKISGLTLVKFATSLSTFSTVFGATNSGGIVSLKWPFSTFSTTFATHNT
jgi:hypothetical protein